MQTIKKIIYTFIMHILILGCSAESKKSEESVEETPTDQEIITEETLEESEKNITEAKKLTVIVSDNKDELRSYYEIPWIKEFYEYEMDMAYEEKSSYEVPEDLSSLSYGDLRLLRNEVFARNGYLFDDGFLRGYFNKNKWYMPIFDVDTFKVVMSQTEQDLVNRLLKEEVARKVNLFVNREGGLKLFNTELVVNKKQFKVVPDKIMKDLEENNFSIIDANRQMPFYVYDRNSYQYIPHYITTDLYLFILHKYFSRFLEKLDENYMSGALEELLSGISKEATQNTEYDSKEVSKWVDMYCKTASFALTGKREQVDNPFSELYETEVAQITGEEGMPVFIENEQVTYAELKPRGHYTKSDKLKNYFKAFKWISLNGIDLANDQQLKGMVLISYIIKSNETLYSKYEEYTSTITKLAGQEDNISIKDIINAIDNNSNITEVLSENSLNSIRTSLGSLNKERIKKVFGSEFYIPERGKTRVYFLSSTYSVSGEIFSKLVHINDMKSKRKFPRPLDIPAVFRDKTAEDIIINEYKDNEKWPEYQTKLNALQTQFDDFRGWESNYGVKGLKTALASLGEQDNYPDFLKTNAYNRKELSTMLSSWTHIKHDLILYQEKPYAAEAGQGGGPEPPKHYSYVEPNIVFWNESMRLVEWLKKLSHLDDTFNYELQKITEIGSELRNATQKQLAGEKLTEDEMRKLSWIGGRIEYTLLGLLETDHLPEREKSMALIADVYAYQNTNLSVAVGHADDIYVIVPINGEYHIARGATFSYYELIEDKIYNDEEWRKKNEERSVPDRPEWISPLINKMAPLEGQMEYRYAGYWGEH
jgi:hypothetical protein